LAQDNKKLKILVVDDDKNFVAMVCEILEMRGYELYFVHNGEDAIDCLREVKPDLIIMDINMPKMGGVALYDKIALPDGTPMYPTIVCSGHDTYKDLFVDLHVDGFVTKPFKVEEFLKTIDEVIRKKKLKDVAGLHQKDTSQKKVLIVEDDAKNRAELSALFLDAGFIVNTASNYEQASERAMPEVYDLIVMKQGIHDGPEFYIGELFKLPHIKRTMLLVYFPEAKKLDMLTEQKLVDLFGNNNLITHSDPVLVFEKCKFTLSR